MVENSTPEIRFSDYLLNENYYLTALEFYYELLERGISCGNLQEFFSDPVNFFRVEKLPTELHDHHSCVSLSTLDSNDIHTSSEDQNSSEDQLKVLEFELRKKNTEIKSLRARLTVATLRESENTDTLGSPTPTPSECQVSKFSTQVTNAETRAIRFLINEHLLNTGCKLTAVQFAEECENDDPQDLEDWDEVGLTCERPPNLVTLLRAAWLPKSGHHSLNSAPKATRRSARGEGSLSGPDVVNGDDFSSVHHITGALHEDLEGSRTALDLLRCNHEATIAELEISRQQVADLRGRVTRLESENVSLSQESTYWRNQLLCLKRDFPDLVATAVVVKANQIRTTSGPQGVPPTAAGEVVEIPAVDATPPSSSSSPSPPESLNRDQSPKIVVELPKLSANQPNFSRRTAPEFVRCVSELLPPLEVDEFPVEAFRLADTLDEIIMTIGYQIKDILKYLPDDKKKLALPLLVQAICLHPDAAIRDQLLRALFNLFAGSPDAGTIEVELKRTYTILRQCRDLAACLGPQRVESELLPQIWSQLNERPSCFLRKLLVSACGVITPATPARLRSSLLLSILLQSVEEEKDETVKASAIRSLTVVVVLMQDREKLSQLVSIFGRALQCAWSSSTGATLPCPCQTPSGRAPLTTPSSSSSSSPTVIGALCDWLLPAIAEFCLEVDSVTTVLLEPWLERLKNLCFINHEPNSNQLTLNSDRDAIRLKRAFPTSDLFQIMTVLNRLTPFLFVSILQSLVFIRPQTPAYKHDCAEEDTLAPPRGLGRDHDLEENANSYLDCWEHLFTPTYILGKRRHAELLHSYEYILRASQIPSGNSVEEGEEEIELPPSLVHEPGGSVGWPAMHDLQEHLLLPIAQMMRAIGPHPNPIGDGMETHDYLEHDPVSPQEFLLLVQVQFEATFWSPWHMSPSSVVLTLLKELCVYVFNIGEAFGPTAVQRYLCEPFQTLLMQRSIQGYFEFNLKALPSGIFAGFCCLLASTQSKSEFSKVKMLITNAIFLHARDSCSLDGVRAVILGLCSTASAASVSREVLLPALRSCASCVDPAVRRTSSNIFHCLIGHLSLLADFNSGVSASDAPSTASPTTGAATVKQPAEKSSWVRGAKTVPSLLGECWQLADQLARDDYASIGTAGGSGLLASDGSFLPVDEHTADWSCIAVALGPLFALYSRMLRSSPYVTDMDLRERRELSENSRILDRVLSLLGRLMSLVVVVTTTTTTTSAGSEKQHSLSPSDVQFLVQRQHWETLVNGLLQVANRLFPTCSEDFRDHQILPWLYRLTEINNMIPNRDQRTRLRQRLMAVFSTAAFYLGTETCVTTWIMPGLDRLRLDFVEAGEKNLAEELEQLSSDLRQRLTNQPSPIQQQAHLTETAKKGLRLKFTNLLSSNFQSTK